MGEDCGRNLKCIGGGVSGLCGVEFEHLMQSIDKIDSNQPSHTDSISMEESIHDDDFKAVSVRQKSQHFLAHQLRKSRTLIKY